MSTNVTLFAKKKPVHPQNAARSTTRTPRHPHLRAQAEDMLRELAFVYHAAQTVRQAMTATQT